MDKLPAPPKEAIFYEDDRLYACLASFPVTQGHSVVVWKRSIKDLHLLSRFEFEHLMNIVDKVRDDLLRTLKVEKVYLVYMDEVEHVHWHLIPRYNEEGFDILRHNPEKKDDFTLSEQLKLNF